MPCRCLILPCPKAGQQSRTTTGPLRRAHLSRTSPPPAVSSTLVMRDPASLLARKSCAIPLRYSLASHARSRFATRSQVMRDPASLLARKSWRHLHAERGGENVDEEQCHEGEHHGFVDGVAD